MTSGESEIFLREVVARPRRYWDADGIPELAIGAFWLLWAGIAVVPIGAPEIGRFQAVLSLLGVLSAPVLMDFAVRRWKQRVTFPRTGYVKLRGPSGSTRLLLVGMAALLGVAAMLLKRFGGHQAVPDWMAGIVGVLISLTLLQLAWRLRSARLAVLCWAVAAVGIAASLLSIQHNLAIVYVFATAGAVCGLDGGLRIRSYMHAHPLPPAEELQ